MSRIEALCGRVGLFFVARGKLLLHSCLLKDAQVYGDFLNFPQSHAVIWNNAYQRQYHVDFDFFPRGRMIYNTVTQTYTVFYDGCITDIAQKLACAYDTDKVILQRDEHYQCYVCNENYAFITGIPD